MEQRINYVYFRGTGNKDLNLKKQGIDYNFREQGTHIGISGTNLFISGEHGNMYLHGRASVMD